MEEALKTEQARPGYKKTKLGWIPEEWKEARLKELVDTSRKIRYGIVQPGEFDPNGRYMLRGQDYSESKGWNSPENLFKVSEKVEKKYRNARLKSGDLIITIVGAGTGHAQEIPAWLEGANITQTTARIALDPSSCSSRYYLNYLNSSNGKKQTYRFMKGGAQPGLNVRDVEEFLVPLPPLPEQRAIARILSTWDKGIQTLQKLIEKKEERKKGLMQVLLSGKVRLEGFNEEWKETRIGQETSCYSGGTPSRRQKSYYNGSIPWIKSGELNSARIDFTEETISEEGLINSSARVVKAGTLLIALYGATAGVTSITNIEAAINQAVLAVEPRTKLNKHFLYYSFKFRMPGVVHRMVQGGQPNLSGSIIKSLKILVPSQVEEQQKIASVLSSADQEIEKLKDQHTKLEEQKKGLMQKLLTGEVRLTNMMK